MSHRPGTWTVTAVFAAVAASATLSLRAGPGPGPGPQAPPHAAPPSIQDALLRPFDFPFARPTPLSQVVGALEKSLGTPVVLDLAGLDRVDVLPDDAVELSLRGVRLRTGLKLLLDQLGLTYRVEPDDNLLVITDAEGAGEPVRELLSQVKELHADVHDLQDAVEEIREALGLNEEGPMVRKPTIIEEVVPGAEVPGVPPAAPPAARTRPGA